MIRTSRKQRFAERRRVRVANEGAPTERVTGKCDLCGGYHAAPDGREVCAVCGKEACWIGCACEEGEG